MNPKHYLQNYFDDNTDRESLIQEFEISRSVFNHFNHTFYLLYNVFSLTVHVFEIVNPVSFLANMIYESNHFNHTEESFNYSIDELMKISPDRFKGLGDYINKRHGIERHKLIADILYADRLGNGDVLSGDGWRFRGQGYIQVTGRNNYKQIAEELNAFFNEETKLTATKVADIAKKIEGAMYISGAWWVFCSSCNRKNVDFKQTVKLVSGSEKTYEKRKKIFDEIIKLKHS